MQTAITFTGLRRWRRHGDKNYNSADNHRFNRAYRQSQADEDIYQPDYPLIHDCIVSIQAAWPEVTMTEKMFFAVMECDAFRLF